MLPRLNDSSLDFPLTSSALENPNGLLAFGGDLSPERLLHAYKQGIFPWYEKDQPILWWSPDPRMALVPDDLHVARSLHKQIRRLNLASSGTGALRLSINERFNEVIDACSKPRPYSDGTWITPEMQHSYQQLHSLGYAVSAELTDSDNRLQGGLYGIALGDIFFGESMFSHFSGASKIVFVFMARLLAKRGYKLIDCQISSDYLASFGASEISRKAFESLLPASTGIPAPDSRWQQEADYSELMS